MMNNKQVAILNCNAPFTNSNAKDALDLALIMGSFEQAVSLFFKADGVFQLINKQSPEVIDAKDFLKTFSAFEFYDIENIYVCQSSLKERGLTNDFHIEGVQCLDKDSFNKKLQQMDVIYNF